MKNKISTILLLICISSVAYAGFVYTWNCKKCGQVRQTQTFTFTSYPSKPTGWGGCIKTQTWGGDNHEWFLTSYFETR